MTESIIPIGDARQDNFGTFLSNILSRLSADGDVVSEAGRAKTLEVFGEELSPQQVVNRICHEVKTEGIEKLLHYTRVLDNAELNHQTIRVSQSEIEAAHDSADEQLKSAVRKIKSNIEHFQSSIKHADCIVEREPNIRLHHRYLPVKRIGICVPGGAAAYPSTVLMTAVLAQVAGVEEIVVVAPPTQFGANNIDVLATCHEVGITEIYRIGGAQAVAALAYGVEGIPKVDMIVGPGNLFVALAKKNVYGQVNIDSIAGPSEVLVIAGPDANPKYVAADMLAQSEHSPGASILLSWDDSQIEAVQKELHEQLALLDRADLTRKSLGDFGAIIRVRDAQHAVEISNSIGPEHLHVVSDQLEEIIKDLTNAGAVFVGNYTPVALGDYVAGPSHVLPTGGTSRWASGLTVNDFLRNQTVISYDRESLSRDAKELRVIATKEGLTAHRNSADIRL